MGMISSNLEDILGMNIAKFPKAQEIGPADELGKTMYMLADSEFTLVGRSLERLFIIIDEDDKVNYVSTGFKGLIDKNFFESLVEKFGTPRSMVRFDGETVEETDVGEDGAIFVSISKDGRPCTFEEEPNLYFWEGSNYSLRITLEEKLHRAEVIIYNK